jgi:hypothetical protein
MNGDGFQIRPSAPCLRPFYEAVFFRECGDASFLCRIS